MYIMYIYKIIILIIIKKKVL